MSEETERITILLQAKDKDFARAMDRNNKLIARLTRDAGKNTSAMSRSVSRNMSSAGASVLAFGKTFAMGLVGGVVGAAFVGITSNLRGLIGDIADLNDAADRMGLGVEELQGLQAGFKLAGVDVENTTKALEIFGQRIGEAATGSGELFQVLKRNNIAIRDQSGNVRPIIDLLKDFAGALDGAGSQSERLSMAADAFGKSGRSMVLGLEGGRGAVDGLIGAARDAGLVIDEELVKKAAILDDRFDVLTMKLGTMFKTVVVEGADFFFAQQTAADLLIEKFGTLAAAQAKIGAAANEFGNQPATAGQAAAIDDLAISYDDLYSSVNAAKRVLSGEEAALFDVGLNDAAYAIDDIITRMDDLIAQFQAGDISAGELEAGLTDATAEASRTLAEIQAINDVDMGSAISVIGALVGALDIAFGAAQKLRASLPGSTAMVSGNDDGRGGNTGNAANFGANPVGTSPRPKPAPQNIDFGIPDTPRGGGGGGASSVDHVSEAYDRLLASLDDAIAVQQRFEEGQKTINDALAAGTITSDEAAHAMDLLTDATIGTADGWDAIAKSLADYAASAQNISGEIGQALVGAFQGAEDAFRNFITTGKADFKSLVQSILADLATLAFKKTILGPLAGLLGLSAGPAVAGVGVSVHHAGGVVGGYAPTRMVSIAAFADAPRMHGGGIAGLRPDEVPAILQKGERVTPRGAGSGGGVINVNINLAGANGDRAIEETAIRAVKLGLGQYDRTLPQRVRAISRDPRRVG